jgi:hypothetical protein
MAHSITSLRTIAHLDWRSFVEGQSAMEAVLRDDPPGSTPRMTFATRDRYRHVVERIAQADRQREEDVARAAVELARSEPGDGGRAAPPLARRLLPRRRGPPRLERATGYRPGPAEAVHRWVLRHPNLVFGGGVLAGTVAALAAVLWLAGPEARTAWLAVLLLALIPGADIAISASTSSSRPSCRPARSRSSTCTEGRHPRRVPDGRGHSHAVRQRGSGAGGARQPGGAVPRQPRVAPPLRRAERLHRRATETREGDRRRSSPPRWRGCARSTRATRPTRTRSTSSTGRAAGIRSRACGWGGSGSAASWRSSTASSAAGPGAPSPWSRATPSRCAASAT